MQRTSPCGDAEISLLALQAGLAERPVPGHEHPAMLEPHYSRSIVVPDPQIYLVAPQSIVVQRKAEMQSVTVRGEPGPQARRSSEKFELARAKQDLGAAQGARREDDEFGCYSEDVFTAGEIADAGGKHPLEVVIGIGKVGNRA